MSRLDGLGFTPIALPLFHYVALPFPGSASKFADAEGYIATSAAALRHTDGAVLRERPIWVVGEATARAALEAGFKDIRTGPGDAAGLAGTIAATDSHRRWLYLAGRARTNQLEEGLRQNGIVIDIAEVYDVSPIDHERDTIAAIFMDRPTPRTLLYSRNAAERFSLLAHHGLDADTLGQLTCLCISANVGEGLGADLAPGARIADEPDERALFRLLADYGNREPMKLV